MLWNQHCFIACAMDDDGVTEYVTLQTLPKFLAVILRILCKGRDALGPREVLEQTFWLTQKTDRCNAAMRVFLHFLRENLATHARSVLQDDRRMQSLISINHRRVDEVLEREFFALP